MTCPWAEQSPIYRRAPYRPLDEDDESTGRTALSEGDLRPFVLHPPRLVVPARQRAGLRGLDGDADAEPDAQRLVQRRAEAVALAAAEGGRGIDADEEVVEAVAAPEHDLELVHRGERPHQLL